MKIAILLCLLARPALAAGIDDDLLAIKKQLVPFATLKGGFEQNKKIRVIKKPLKSAGDFTLLKGKGVLWRTTSPMASTVRVSRDDIAQIKDGKALVMVSMKDQPALGLIGKVLFALFSADIDELKRHFEFTAATAPNGAGHWNASLRPRDAMVRKVVSRIELEGGRVVDALTLYEVNGDYSVIHFKDVAENGPLNKEEAALFE